MKKKLLIGLMTMSVILGLTGCGSSSNFGSYVDKSYSPMEMNSVAGEAYYDSDSYYGYNENYDYGSTTIKGKQVDYSYDVGARGSVESKSVALDFYEDLSKFVDDNDGYIENVNNTYSDNYIEPGDYYISDYDILYAASGRLNFTVQIEEEHSADVIALFDKFCEEQNLTITAYNQYITNYDHYEVRDENDDDNYYHWKMTQKELDEAVKYSDIDVRIDYQIDRPGGAKTALKISKFFKNFWDSASDILTAIFWVCVWVYVALFVILLPVIKIIKKSMYKFYTKHPEYRVSKIVQVVDPTKVDSIKVDATPVKTDGSETMKG